GGLLSTRAAGPGLEKATTSARSIPCALGAAIGFSERCRALGVFPSPLWGGVGVGVVVWGKIGASPAPPPSPTLPQPAAGLPASGKLKGDQTPAGRGLVGGGSRLRLPHVRTSFHKRAVVCSHREVKRLTRGINRLCDSQAFVRGGGGRSRGTTICPHGASREFGPSAIAQSRHGNVNSPARCGLRRR